MRRSNCTNALQYVPELTRILFLRILDAQEMRDQESAKAVGAGRTPALRASYRRQDWAAPRSDRPGHPETPDGKPFGWKRHGQFVQDILAELAPSGTCAIVLDDGLLFRTDESAFVETKLKLADECDLWAIARLPGGVFSSTGASVDTSLLSFTKGRRTGRIRYDDLSQVKVGKKTPLTLTHFGFAPDGSMLDDAALPAARVADWQADEAKAGKPFPSYAGQLARRGTPHADSHWSWTADLAARRASIDAQGKIVAQALARLGALLKPDAPVGPNVMTSIAE
jgi:hypothetical protein